jgi:hypothetical protein
MELNNIDYQIRNNKISHIAYDFSASEKEDKNKMKDELKDSMAFLTQKIESMYGEGNFDKTPTNDIKPDSIRAGFRYELKSKETFNPLITSIEYKANTYSNEVKTGISLYFAGNREDLMLNFYDKVKGFPEIKINESAKTNINSFDFILKGDYKKNDFGLLELIE